MKTSIRLKMAGVLGAVIVVFVAVSILLSSLFLNTYYIYRKEGSLRDTYSQVKNLYAQNPADLNTQLDAIETASGIYITIFDPNINIKYESRPFRRPDQAGQGGLPTPSFNPGGAPGAANFEENMLRQEAEKIVQSGTVIERSGAERGPNPGYLQLGARLNATDMIYLRTAVAAIQESVGVANAFSLYTGILTLILGVVIIFFISRSFARPITELSAIAKRMEKMDFDAKFKGKSRDEIGELGQSINSLSDQLHRYITELEDANQGLKEDVLRKEETDRMRREFLSSASHELKTPLALIQGYAEGLAMNVNVDAKSRMEYCEVIMDETRKMDKLVKQLLDISRMEAGQIQLDWENFALVELVERALKKHRIAFQNGGIESEKDVDCNVNVHADFEMMERVLDNYLSNAIRHVDGKRTIRIRSYCENGKAVVSVFNSGRGIPEKEMEKIWTSFYKADKARTRELGGTGLGLSIVKAVMDAHGEECGVKNVPGGVEFWFSVKLSRGEQA